jgi:hypothetical protein
MDSPSTSATRSCTSVYTETRVAEFDSLIGADTTSEKYDVQMSIVPSTFVETLSVAEGVLRESGIACCVYADDLLITAPSEPPATLYPQRAIDTLTYFGWHVSELKSDKAQSQSFIYLGLDCDTTSMTVGIPASKSANIRKEKEARLSGKFPPPLRV